jgi:type II secretory ATPase GspE/PulE/Tfp pilus assembly ATPase PilB-like protein
MRQDPDIIMVGEIRDLETAEMAVQAALTGTWCSRPCIPTTRPSAVTRLMELGVPPT